MGSYLWGVLEVNWDFYEVITTSRQNYPTEKGCPFETPSPKNEPRWGGARSSYILGKSAKTIRI